MKESHRKDIASRPDPESHPALVSTIITTVNSLDWQQGWTPRETQVLREVTAVLKEFLHPVRIILFGSRAKGRGSSTSDFDFAVDVPRPDPGTRRHLEDQIEEVSGLYKIDVVYLPAVEPAFRGIIEKTGITLV